MWVFLTTRKFPLYHKNVKKTGTCKKVKKHGFVFLYTWALEAPWVKSLASGRRGDINYLNRVFTNKPA